jgi:hypothetical protein
MSDYYPIYAGKSEAEKLRDHVAKEKGRSFRKFRRQGFYAIDNDASIFEKSFPEIKETVQVQLTKYGKIKAVYLLKK